MTKQNRLILATFMIIISFMMKLMLWYSQTIAISANFYIGLWCDIISWNLLYLLPTYKKLNFIWISMMIGWVFISLTNLGFLSLMDLGLIKWGIYFVLYYMLFNLLTKPLYSCLGSIVMTCLSIWVHEGTLLIFVPLLLGLYIYYHTEKKIRNMYLIVVLICEICGIYLIGYQVANSNILILIRIDTVVYSLFICHIIFLLNLVKTKYMDIKINIVLLKNYVYLYIYGLILLVTLTISLTMYPNYPSRYIMFTSWCIGLLVYFLYYYNTKQNIAKRLSFDSIFETWQTERLECYHEDHSLKNLWMGLDVLVESIISNDGFEIIHDNSVLHSYGLFRMSPPIETVNLPINDRFISKWAAQKDHKPFLLAQLYAITYLNGKLETMLEQVEVINRYVKDSQIENEYVSYNENVELRKKISYYLHDYILQDLLASRNLLYSINTPDESVKQLVGDTLSSLSTSIRNQMHEIFPSSLRDLKFSENIIILVERIKNKFPHAPQILIHNHLVTELSLEYKYFIYQSILELLNNACKYAEASKIIVTFSESDDEIKVTVCDDGKLFELEEANHDAYTHLGIKRLMSDAKLLKGSFSYQQEEGSKTFTLLLPKQGV